MKDKESCAREYAGEGPATILMHGFRDAASFTYPFGKDPEMLIGKGKPVLRYIKHRVQTCYLIDLHDLGIGVDYRKFALSHLACRAHA